MKQAYNNISLTPGAHNKGLVSIKVAAKEWLSNTVLIDFATGAVSTAITFLTGKGWIDINFIPGSYTMDEIPKISKNGTAYEITIAGTINNNDVSIQQIIESIRYNELIIIATDKNGDRKITGNTLKAMLPSFINKTISSSQQINASFSYESDTIPPFYTA